mmetsp:Transcript_31166/g.69299  ORF Transcript_31166/g.69299 Transcript_31166/m.69299 type:complete len:442 (+) Transcript_31166:223-1548(+)
MSSLQRDVYGFQLPQLSAHEADARARCLSQAKAAKQWASKKLPDVQLPGAQGSFISEIGKYQVAVSAPQDLKGLVRLGIPESLRPAAWFWLSGGWAKQSAAPEGYYRKLSASSEAVSDEVVFAIEQDVGGLWHSMRQHSLFQTSKGQEALTRVLLALAQHLPECGYVKGLHQVSALLLVVMGLPQEEAVFWTLVALLQDKLFPYCGGALQHGARIEQGVLELLIQRKLPALWSHLVKMGWDVSRLTAGWFTSLFTTVLPPETVVRVWDAIMSEGSKVMHRVALALIKRHETVILGCAQLDLMRRVLELRLSRAFDVDDIMQVAFHGIGSMPASLITKFRDQALGTPVRRSGSHGSSGSGGSGRGRDRSAWAAPVSPAGVAELLLLPGGAGPQVPGSGTPAGGLSTSSTGSVASAAPAPARPSPSTSAAAGSSYRRSQSDHM